MNIKKFDKNKKKKTYIAAGIVFVVFAIVGITIYRSWALYQENKSYNVLAGVIPDFSKSDIALTFTIDGETSNEAFPGKDSGYVGTATCENGVSASWDNDSWGLVVSNSNNQSNIVCNVDFSKGTKATEYITNLASTSSEIVDDETSDHNLRYIGKDPSNYVLFNNELWRIIGVMNDVADESGTIEPRIKLIRSESIGNYSWDNKGTSGSNDWSDSAIQEVLNNGAYYNRTSGLCPSGQNGATTACDFSESGLTSDAKSMISKVKWKLGGTANYTTSSDGLVSYWYGYERGTTVYSGRLTDWTGEVGLMYPSDYGYATSGGSTTDRNSCLNKEIYNWKESGRSNCKYNDWLYNSSSVQWTITPDSAFSSIVFEVNSTGGVYSHYAYNTNAVRPVVYLRSSTMIKSGTGTSSDPFVLGA